LSERDWDLTNVYSMRDSELERYAMSKLMQLMIKAALQIQLRWRMHVARMRRATAERRRQRMARVLQRWWRYILRFKLSIIRRCRERAERNRACVQITKFIRGRQVRDRVKTVRDLHVLHTQLNKLQHEWEKKHMLWIIRMQSVVRGFLARRRVAQRRKALKALEVKAPDVPPSRQSAARRSSLEPGQYRRSPSVDIREEESLPIRSVMSMPPAAPVISLAVPKQVGSKSGRLTPRGSILEPKAAPPSLSSRASTRTPSSRATLLGNAIGTPLEPAVAGSRSLQQRSSSCEPGGPVVQQPTPPPSRPNTVLNHTQPLGRLSTTSSKPRRSYQR